MKATPNELYSMVVELNPLCGDYSAFDENQRRCWVMCEDYIYFVLNKTPLRVRLTAFDSKPENPNHFKIWYCDSDDSGWFYSLPNDEPRRVQIFAYAFTLLKEHCNKCCYILVEDLDEEEIPAEETSAGNID